MKPKHTGPAAMIAFATIIGALIAHDAGYIDLEPVFAALRPLGQAVVAAIASTGLTGTQGTALLIGTPFLVGGAQMISKGLPAFPRAVTVLLSNPDAEAGKLHQATGAVELEGTAQVLDSAGTATSPYGGTDCLAYVYERQERRPGTGTGGGRSGSSWATVDEGREGFPFLLADETGEVPVTAQEATVTLDFTETSRGPDHKTKEGVLEPGDNVYVYGHVRDGTAGDPQAPPNASTYVGPPRDGDGPFIVSDASETWTGLRFGAKAVFLTLGGIFLAAGGLALMWYTGALQQLASTFL